ncbi:MAG: polar amino acid transport system substrate-binding protein [Gaiellaceae bacterium]|nr:polar amino acid transport system substrate-binding protein [Gaiellaceae bacterium]
MRRFAALALGTVLLAAGCDGGSKSSSGSTTASTGTAAAQAQTMHAGVLTVGAEFPAPGFLNPPRTKPTGFEADVANEIAKRLGLQTVTWAETPFTSLFSPAPKKFDFDINEITITPERQKVVDFSVPYFDANQALLVHKGTPIASAKTLADLKQYQLGGQATTTGVDYIKKTIKPTKKAREYSTTGAAAQALVVKQIDAFVIDVPIAAALVKQYPNDLTIVGQFITNEQYGILFQKGSKLKPAVDKALTAMKDDGTLKKLQNKWFPGTADLVEIK